MSGTPNVLFLFSDQQRWDTCGCYGQPLETTPNLDRMAREGVLFRNAFTCQPVCGPARACLQTGRYAAELGCFTNNRRLPPGERTLAHCLAERGYDTGYIGKWHLASSGPAGGPDDFKTKPVPPDRRGGYDFWLASDVLEFTSHGYGGHMFDGQGRRRDFPEGRYRVDTQTDWVLEYLSSRRPADKPFFLFVSYLEPHHQNDHGHFEGPLGSKRKFADFIPPGDLVNSDGNWREEYPDYLGCVHSLDANVGRIRAALEKSGLAQNTLVIYTSDHGSHFCTRNSEYKRACHEGCIRVPLIIAGPGFQGGRTAEELISLIDLPPTVLTAAGLAPPAAMRGRPVQDLFSTGKPAWPEEVFLQISESQCGRAIRTNRWKYSVRAPHTSGSAPSSDVYAEDFLYDLAADPHEQQNLVADPDCVSIRRELAQRLKRRMAQAGEAEPRIVDASGVRSTDGTTLTAAPASAERKQAKPNIVYILADDMGYGDLSCLNPDSKIRTPHLDRLAAEGLRCCDTHASSAVCTPSRYSLLTGRYNWRSRLKEGVTFGYSEPLIPPGRMTVASLLRDHGYRTACIGKWHLGWNWARTSTRETDVDFGKPITGGPTALGFDYFFGIPASLDMPPYVYVENELATAIPDRIIPAGSGKQYWREGPIAPDYSHADALSVFTEKAEGFIRRQAKQTQPFFLYFPLSAPHTPILPGAAFRGKSGTNDYGDFCLQVDDVVGTIDRTLRECGLADNTILIFTADNGCSPMADFDELARCGHRPSHVFRGHKADIYEGGHRVPFLARWPGIIEPDSRTDETVCLSDLLATCAAILGVALPDNAGEDSISNLGVWRGEPPDTRLREATIHHSIDGSFSIRRGRWKLEMCPGSGGWSHPRPGKECEGLQPIQLYDLDADIGERRNVGADHPEVVAELTALLTRYVRDGRSTPGAPQRNDDGAGWKQLWWMGGSHTA